ncbi:2,3-diaminopropionate biosynthesis protein SbnB [Lentzea sp. NBRC 105346]|uniref:2,3-diaminopropionate biosynthesis protein SbnB n=1 Tax=Lentzea sp. NBRC 105346 TaxID=3032205 RepID=UPI00249F9F67|nr:2,3-diaminopropionate biosynthesis protein SbnB [Lentzea sp. NBRC 105346]GLZ29095.1 2,3-diaminopropionate biosynthesis protein SbnB [Lentzea sp. NBRC 105346]
MVEPRPFAVVSGAQVRSVLQGNEKKVRDLVEDAYRMHGEGRTVNPPSYFLRFPDRPSSRIIALPASLGGPDGVDGLKWVSSFPSNVESGLPRASAVLILNDPNTGYPFACFESSIISAARTASSAALAADVLTRDRPRPTRIGYIGTGLIARYVHTHLVGTGWDFSSVRVHDLSSSSALGFKSCVDGEVLFGSAEEVIRSSDVVVFTTVAASPHVHDVSWFAHNPLVLHVSLRDLSPEIILSSFNVVDDVDHCLKADTSPHLAEQQVGNRSFVHATLPQVLAGGVTVPSDQPIIFSPFGLGVLDLALARFVYDSIAASGTLQVVPDFFAELSRYGTTR